MTQTIVIHGDPVAKGRPKLTTRGGFARAYTPAKTRNAEAHIQSEVRKQWALPMLEGPLKLEVALVMPRPKTMPKKERWDVHTKRPDVDNLVKTVLDALNGVCWKDDSQVCQLSATKFYGEEVGTAIIITTL